AQFEGYTSGGGKELREGRMSTGDLGRFEDGLLFVEGRDDEMIVSGGENVYPQEVEDCLARHRDVVEAAAVAAPDPQFGQRLVAYVVARDGADVTEDDLKEHVKQRLARYKVPRDVLFVGELPRNATGKVLKRVLGPGDDEERG
ncbi:MAG: AMP-binding enzyme, partial [Nocardioidaceae bacterium]